MQAPIGPAATTDLVKAVSAMGALGTLAASWTEAAVLRRQLRELRASVGTCFCVNLVLAFAQRERLDVALEEGAGFVSFSWGVDPESIKRAREGGAVVLVQVGGARAAREAADAGADVVIAQGVEAGGHVEGTTPLLELLRALRPRSTSRSSRPAGSPMPRRRRPRGPRAQTASRAEPPFSPRTRQMSIRDTSSGSWPPRRRTRWSRTCSTSAGPMRRIA
jgi:Nitronate monooxygenase